MKETPPLTLPGYPVQYIPNTQDEISLVDMWRTLRKHRKVFLTTAVAVTLLGLIAALLIPKSHTRRTSLAIGTTIRGKALVPIESPQTVKAKLENSFIPMAKNSLNAERKEAANYNLNVSTPKKSTLIVRDSKTTEQNEEIYKGLHYKVVDAVTQDHAKLLTVLRTKLETELALAKITLEEMQDPSTLEALIKPQEKILVDAKSDLDALSNPEIFGATIKAAENRIQGQTNKFASLEDQKIILDKQLEQINANQDLIQIQIKELETQINDAMALQKNSAKGVKSETQAMAQLMINSEVQQNRKWLAALKERTFITLENEKSSIRKSLEDNKQAQALQLEKIAEAEAGLKELTGRNLLEQNKLKATIAESESSIAKLSSDQKRTIATQQQAVLEIQAKLNNFVETRAVLEPTLSPEPTSTPKRVILLITVLLGAIIGVVAVFFAALREKVAEADSVMPTNKERDAETGSPR